MKEIVECLRLNIDDNVLLQKWEAKKKLSLKLAGDYEYFLVQLLGEEFLLVRPYEQQTIKKIKLQLSLIEEQANMPVAVILEKTTVYIMKKMLQEKVPFVAVDQQMYLPFMALYIKKQRNILMETVVHEKFTPATQMIFLFILYSEKEIFCIEELSEQLSISSMTVVRGMDELKRIGLVDYEIGGQTGRKKVFRRIPRKEYYGIGKNYLQNPVRKTIFVSKIPNHLNAYKSGLTALGEQTMLGEPSQEVYAVDSKAEKQLKEFQVSKETAMEEIMPKVQIMKYDIGTLTTGEYVDPITLITGLDEKDDRIEIAIEEFMGDMEWFVE